jgi:hypothetical protein
LNSKKNIYEINRFKSCKRSKRISNSNYAIRIDFSLRAVLSRDRFSRDRVPPRCALPLSGFLHSYCCGGALRRSRLSRDRYGPLSFPAAMLPCRGPTGSLPRLSRDRYGPRSFPAAVVLCRDGRRALPRSCCPAVLLSRGRALPLSFHAAVDCTCVYMLLFGGKMEFSSFFVTFFSNIQGAGTEHQLLLLLLFLCGHLGPIRTPIQFKTFYSMSLLEVDGRIR